MTMHPFLATVPTMGMPIPDSNNRPSGKVDEMWVWGVLDDPEHEGPWHPGDVPIPQVEPEQVRIRRLIEH